MRTQDCFSLNKIFEQLVQCSKSSSDLAILSILVFYSDYIVKIVKDKCIMISFSCRATT